MAFGVAPLCPEDHLKVMPVGYERTGRPCARAVVQCGVKPWITDVHWGLDPGGHQNRSHLETANGRSYDKLALDFKDRLWKGAGVSGGE